MILVYLHFTISFHVIHFPYYFTPFLSFYVFVDLSNCLFSFNPLFFILFSPFILFVFLFSCYTFRPLSSLFSLSSLRSFQSAYCISFTICFLLSPLTSIFYNFSTIFIHLQLTLFILFASYPSTFYVFSLLGFVCHFGPHYSSFKTLSNYIVPIYSKEIRLTLSFLYKVKFSGSIYVVSGHGV